MATTVSQRPNSAADTRDGSVAFGPARAVVVVGVGRTAEAEVVVGRAELEVEEGSCTAAVAFAVVED